LVSPAGSQVNVDFRAWAAGAGFAHHPEIVLLVAGNDVDFGVEAGGGEFGGPKIISFLIEIAGIALRFVGTIDGGVKALRWEISRLLRDEFPRPVNGLAS
jgi:hypothetical protein